MPMDDLSSDTNYSQQQYIRALYHRTDLLESDIADMLVELQNMGVNISDLETILNRIDSNVDEVESKLDSIYAELQSQNTNCVAMLQELETMNSFWSDSSPTWNAYVNPVRDSSFNIAASKLKSVRVSPANTLATGLYYLWVVDKASAIEAEDTDRLLALPISHTFLLLTDFILDLGEAVINLVNGLAVGLSSDPFVYNEVSSADAIFNVIYAE